MDVNSLPKTVTRQRRDCDLNPGPSAPQFSTLTIRLPSQPHTCAALVKHKKRRVPAQRSNAHRMCEGPITVPFFVRFLQEKVAVLFSIDWD